MQADLIVIYKKNVSSNVSKTIVHIREYLKIGLN